MSPSGIKARMMMLIMMMSSGLGGSVGDEDSSTPTLPKYGKLGMAIENKMGLLARSFELVKTIIGSGYTSWREVPNELKLAIWVALQVMYLYLYLYEYFNFNLNLYLFVTNIVFFGHEQFSLDPKLRDSVLEQLREQHKTWKKNMRTRYFGKTRESVI